MVDGIVEYIRENWSLLYTATFIYCPLRNNGTVPTSVSLYAKEEVAEAKKNDPVELPTAHNRVQVHRNQEKSGATLAACVKPIHYQFGKVCFGMFVYQKIIDF